MTSLTENEPDALPSGQYIRVGPEVEICAAYLDACLSNRDAPPQQRRQAAVGLVTALYEYACDRRDQLRRPNRRLTSIQQTPREDLGMDMEMDEQNETGDVRRAADLLRWELEASTWDLLRRLLPLRYPAAGVQNFPSGHGNRTPLETFVASDPAAAERCAVLQWLQQNAKSGPDISGLVRDLQRNAERGDILAQGWLHTKSAIKLRKSVTGSEFSLDLGSKSVEQTLVNSANDPLVTNLDPDAATRQRRRLQPPDDQFERGVWVGCYELLRRGSSLEAIRDWCAERSEKWRAVSLSALPPDLDDKANLIEGRLGPSSLVIWRRACFALCRKGGSNDYERAVYGILSGDIPSTEKVSKSWDDILFVHYNALLRSQLDNYLLHAAEIPPSVLQALPVFDAVQYHHGDARIERRLMKALESDSRVAREANHPARALQSAILGGDVDRHLYQQGLVTAMHANAQRPSKMLPGSGSIPSDINSDRFFGLSDHAGLRISAHVLLILCFLDDSGLVGPEAMSLGCEPSRKSTQENLVASYVSFLRLSGLEELIPLYCCQMQTPRVYEVLSRNLIHLTDRRARATQLSLISKSGLDAMRFVRLQPQLLFAEVREQTAGKAQDFVFRIVEPGATSLKFGRSVRTDFFGDDPDRLERLDDMLIRTAEWYTLMDREWPAVFALGIRLYKYFLKNGLLNAARSLAVRIPFADVVRERLAGAADEDLDQLSHDDLDFWARHLGPSDIGAMDVVQVAADARTFRELESLVRALDTMETLASLAELSRENPSSRRDFWVKVSSELKAAKDHMRPLLKNWLLGGIEDHDEDLEYIRNTYLPETILAYVSTLHFAGTCLSRDHLLECMELAAKIAEKDSDLGVCFSMCNRMKELVEALASCSKALAVMSGESRPASGSKKQREIGWSKDLWIVK